MIVKDEARRLACCLDSVIGLEPEIIIADTGSSDSTLDIAREFGANVSSFDFQWIDFAAARNHTLRQAHGKWILVLDADETLQPASVAVVEDLIVSSQNAGYYFERLNYTAKPDAPISDFAVRLFPNRPDYLYRGRVHETIDSSILSAGGKLVRSRARIDHDFASDPECRREKNLLYIGILNEEIAKDPHDTSRLDFLAAEYHQLGLFHEAAAIAERIADVRWSDATAHLRAGVYHLLFTQEPERARADFLHALRLRPNFEEALAFLRRMEWDGTGAQGVNAVRTPSAARDPVAQSVLLRKVGD